MNFHDIEHDFATLSFHGIEDLEIDSSCDAKAIAAIESWKSRPEKSSYGTSLLKIENTLGFFIDYKGVSSDHWPNERSNLLSESLVREYLFNEGICSVNSELIRLLKVNYSIMAGEYGIEYILVCPETNKNNNIDGLSIVCLNNYIIQ